MGLTDKKLLHVKQIYKNRILVQGTIVTGKYYENIYYITEKKNPKPKQTNKQKKTCALNVLLMQQKLDNRLYLM